MGFSKLDTLAGRPDFIKKFVKSYGKTNDDILAADATETTASNKVAHQGWTIPAGGNDNPNAMRETIIAMNIGSDIGTDDDAGLGIGGSGGGGGYGFNISGATPISNFVLSQYGGTGPAGPNVTPIEYDSVNGYWELNIHQSGSDMNAWGDWLEDSNGVSNLPLTATMSVYPSAGTDDGSLSFIATITYYTDAMSHFHMRLSVDAETDAWLQNFVTEQGDIAGTHRINFYDGHLPALGGGTSYDFNSHESSPVTNQYGSGMETYTSSFLTIDNMSATQSLSGGAGAHFYLNTIATTSQMVNTWASLGFLAGQGYSPNGYRITMNARVRDLAWPRNNYAGWATNIIFQMKIIGNPTAYQYDIDTSSIVCSDSSKTFADWVQAKADADAVGANPPYAWEIQLYKGIPELVS